MTVCSSKLSWYRGRCSALALCMHVTVMSLTACARLHDVDSRTYRPCQVSLQPEVPIKGYILRSWTATHGPCSQTAMATAFMHMRMLAVFLCSRHNRGL